MGYSAVVLAAGEGKRLRPLTTHRPKPMLPAATKPILEHVFDALIDAGVTDITVVVGYRRTRVQSEFGPSYRDVPLTYVTQGKQLGSGHALLAAEQAVEGSTLVVNGDQLIDSRIIRDVVEAHDGESTAATLGLVRRADVTRYGGVLLEDGEVTEIVENPRDDRSYRLNAGVYAFEPAIFEAIRESEPRAGEQSLVDGIDTLLEDGTRVQGVVSEGTWIDATYPWDLLRIADDLLEAGEGRRIADSASVHESATVIEPVVIDDDCVVGPGAVVGPNVCLGENATVGSNVTLERSVVDTDTRVDNGATVRDCVTGRGVEIGPNSTVVGGPGDVEIGDRIHRETSLGAVLADHVRDEGGVTYEPGSVVGNGAVCHVGATVGGTLSAETEVWG
ncbi:sugar phosphate nucleotidyltransferase [Natronococcus occultus]|uniref:Bifunctional protein GlmU n=1 Tax=Natronococcus occultus SP4 TaxID=694430 RepID=L0K106_9EURY|nr:sugar phosphate nucleotidyltransferase [Natronococcus occultus]AGB38982.1 Nucleoside-diphosphate-sugar pyrophosphorylase family protein [Natronococcus occultus SP4]